MKLKWELKRFSELTPMMLWKMYNFRDQVFVVEQRSPYLDADKNDLKSYHLFAFNSDNQLVAYSRFYKTSGFVSFGRVVVAKSMRGKDLGKTLLMHTMNDVHKIYGSPKIIIEAQCQAIGFYKQFGFHAIGQPFMDTGVKHIKMVNK